MATIDLIVLGILKKDPMSAYDIQKLVEYRKISKWVKISTPSPEKQKSCIAEIEENVSILKSYLEDNIREKENEPSIPATGMAVLRQQYVLVEAIQAWISSLNII